MPKKKVKKRKKKIITKRKTKAKSLAPKQEKEIIYRTKKDWISKALVNKSQYEKKYKIKKFDNMDLEASPRLALDTSAKFLKGAGVVL